MNGTIYDEIKKNDNSKKKEKLKFVMAMVSTNLLVLTLALSFGKTENAPQVIQPHPIKLTHQHFKMIIVPLTLLIEQDFSLSEIPITLMGKDKKILIIHAYLHEEVKSKGLETENATRFKIEIPEEEVIKLSSDSMEQMIAIPELKLPEKAKKLQLKRVSKYETDL